MWLNQIVAEEDALYCARRLGAPARRGRDPAHRATRSSWASTAARPTTPPPSSPSASATAVAFVLGVWEKPDGPAGDGWEVNRDAVDSAVHDAFRVFDVQGFYADVALWESYISDWSATYARGPGGQGRRPHRHRLGHAPVACSASPARTSG